jgi:hypothetical protein
LAHLRYSLIRTYPAPVRRTQNADILFAGPRLRQAAAAGILRRLGLLAALLGAFGCAPKPAPVAAAGDVLFVVPGAGGYAPGYARMIEALRSGGVKSVQLVDWGSPVFVLNLQDRGIHERAEQKLRAAIDDRHARFPGARIDLLGHSAGCGVILGALAKLEAEPRIGSVVLLAPSVSPTYELAPALAHLDGKLHVFYSERDTLWLKWRTGHFGTYDNLRTPAAGNLGFQNTEQLPPALRGKLEQYRYDAAWRPMGNDGGHFGPVAPHFAAQVVAPLLLTP